MPHRGSGGPGALRPPKGAPPLTVIWVYASTTDAETRWAHAIDRLLQAGTAPSPPEPAGCPSSPNP